MYITIGIIIGFVVFSIGLIVGKVSETNPLPRCCTICLNEHKCMQPPFGGEFCCDHFGIGSLRRELESEKYQRRQLEKEIYQIKENSCPRRCFRNNQTCSNCEIKVYAKTVQEQEVIDLLTKGMKPLEELRKKLL